MDFQKQYDELNNEQRQAVDYIDGPLLVIAGPGTGKTQLLSMRVANILRQTDTAAENILCLTFTETGAQNMRDRLAALAGAEGRKVNVATYHAFGSLILQEHRPDLSAAADELEQFTLIREIQAGLAHDDILKAEWQTKEIMSTISDVKAALLTPADLRKIAQRNEIDIAKMNLALSETINSVPLRAKWADALAAYEQNFQCLMTFTSGQPIVGKIEPIANHHAATLGEIMKAEIVKDKPSVSVFTKWRRKYFSKNNQDEWVLDNYVANKKLLSLANIMERYESALTTAGHYDYDDMILAAIRLLEENAEVRYNAQEYYQYILLDEFQDTNDAQARLVQLLTENPANDGKPNVMAVGDDDQAIYGFQGAKSSNFLDFDEMYHPKIITLTKNYRSSAPILEFAHKVIEQAEDRFSQAREIEKNISAENPPAKTDIDRREFLSATAEYHWVADKIAELLAAGVNGREIAVIAPKHKYLVSLLPFLRQHEIALSYQKRENILDDPMISEVLATCELLLALSKDFARADSKWFRVLLSSGLNVKVIVDELAAARQNDISLAKQLLSSENEKIAQTATWLISLAGKVADFSVEYIINEIIVHNFQDTQRYELLTNLTVLREMLRAKMPGGEKILLADFMKTIVAHQAAEIAILNKSPYHESTNAVKLLTVHSAKGLEFQHVFMIATDDQNWGNAKGNTNRLSLPRNMEAVRHVGDSLDERVRILFVAITRARTNLYLSSSLADFSGKTVQRLKFLNEREIQKDDGREYIMGDIIPESFAEVKRIENESISADDLGLSWFSAYVPSTKTERQLWLPVVENYKISPTHLNTFIDLDYAGPEEFLRRYIYKLPQEASESQIYGNIVHEVMQKLVEIVPSTEQKAEDFVSQMEQLLQLFEERLAEADLDETEKTQLLAQGQDNLRTYLAVRGAKLHGMKAVAEKSFRGENILLGETPITGKIDRIEINEVAKTITVVDFKTGAPKSKWSNHDGTLKYKLQLYFYKFLLENSREYRGYAVTDGRIEFIRPDDHDKIVSLELQFNEKDAEMVRQLITAVYMRVKTLDLPDVSGFDKKSWAFIEHMLAE